MTLVNTKGDITHHDNACRQTSTLTKNLLVEFGLDILIHTPHCPGIVPSDYHLFRRLQNHLVGLRFKSREDVENELGSYFTSKYKEFYRRSIYKLVDRGNIFLKSRVYIIE